MYKKAPCNRKYFFVNPTIHERCASVFVVIHGPELLFRLTVAGNCVRQVNSTVLVETHGFCTIVPCSHVGLQVQ